MTQCETILNAFQNAHGKTLTTGQLRRFYIANPNARISQLKADGHVIVATKIKGNAQWKFEYLGKTEPVPMVPDVKAMKWHPLPNNFEVQYVR